jgi:hypothetical protein
MKATINARRAIVRGILVGEQSAIKTIPIMRRNWTEMIHPRLRPSHGGTKRSINGDQRNFKTYGNPTIEKIPIVFKSRPSVVSHAWSVPHVNGRGSPDENPRSTITAIRRLVNILK